MFRADTLASPSARTYGHGLGEPDFQRDLFARNLSYGEWAVVKEACDHAGLVFLASVFDEEAVDAAEDMGMEAYKIASGDITNRPLLQYVAGTRKPVLLSTGASLEYEVRRALWWLGSCPVIPLACSLEYPTPPSRAHLRRIEALFRLTDRVGYSNHVPGTLALVGARQLGACVVETHFTITPGKGGDHDFAVTADQLLSIDWHAGIPDGMLGEPVLGVHEGEWDAWRGARRSICAKTPIRGGTRFDAANLICLRPGRGLEPWEIDRIVGHTVSRDYGPGEQISLVEANQWD